MKKVLLIFLSLSFIVYVKAQDKPNNYLLKFKLGYSKINYMNVNNTFQMGFSIDIHTKNKIGFQIGYDYMLGSHISRDKLDTNPRQFNYQRHIQQGQLNSLITYPLVSNKAINLQIQSGISFNFIKQSYVNNIYEKLIIPNSSLVLVSESTFKKKFQLGSISSLETSFKLKRFSPGISLQYQIQKEYQFFSPSVFISYKL